MRIVTMNIEPGLYPSIGVIVSAMNTKIREPLGAQVFEYNGIYVSVDKNTQKRVYKTDKLWDIPFFLPKKSNLHLSLLGVRSIFMESIGTVAMKNILSLKKL